MRRYLHDAEAGFTLLETIIAMTLLAILMLALSGSIGFVGRTWDKGWRAGERSGALAQAEGTMRQMLERSFPVGPDVQKQPHVIFRGNAAGLQFVSYEVGAMAPGYRLSAFFVNVANGTPQLVFRQGTSPAMSLDESEERVMYQGDINLDCAYYGALSAATPATWHREWVSDRYLPEIIQVRFRDSVTQIWPTIVIRPIVDAEYACISRSFPGTCRLAGLDQ